MNVLAPTPLLAALYRRVSTDKQDDSLDLQERRTLDYARFKGLEVSENRIFSDPDTSGRIPMHQRVGGKALLFRLRQGDVHHLVIAKLDRLGRNVRDALSVLESLSELRVTLHIVDLGGESVTTQGHMGRLILTLLLAVAEWEVMEIRDRTTKQMNQLFEKGALTGNVPYGYDCLYTFADGDTHSSPRALSHSELSTLNPQPTTAKQLVPNLPEQKTLRLMATWRAAGWSLKRIASELNASGRLSKLGRPWQCGNVDSVLKSRHTIRLLESPGFKAA